MLKLPKHLVCAALALCGWLITQDPARPAWNAHDFFGDHYAKKM